MAIHRAPRPESNYAQIRNDVLRDERLSYRARGVLATILSHTDAWSTSAESLARQGQEGRDAIRTALSELEAAGYLVRERRQDAGGRWATASIIYDTPRVTPVQDALGLVMAGSAEPMPENPSSVTDDWKTDAGYSGPSKNTNENSSPTGKASASAQPPEAVIAKAVYDAAQGMTSFMGVRTIAARALKMASKPSPEQVQAALLALLAEGRPLTMATLGQRLNPTTKTGTAPVSDWSERTSW